MAVALVNSFTNRVTGTASATLAGSVTSDAGASGPNTVAILCVGVCISNSATGSTGSATYGGTAMTQTVFTQWGGTTFRGCNAFYTLFNPPTGSQTVTFTSGGAPLKNVIHLDCLIYSGADSISNVTAIVAGSSGSGSQTITSTVSDDRAVHMTLNDGAYTGQTGGTVRYNDGASITGGGDYMLVMDSPGAPGGITFTMTTAIGTPRYNGLNIVAAAVTTPATPLLIQSTWAARERANVY